MAQCPEICFCNVEPLQSGPTLKHVWGCNFLDLDNLGNWNLGCNSAWRLLHPEITSPEGAALGVPTGCRKGCLLASIALSSGSYRTVSSSKPQGQAVSASSPLLFLVYHWPLWFLFSHLCQSSCSYSPFRNLILSKKISKNILCRFFLAAQSLRWSAKGYLIVSHGLQNARASSRGTWAPLPQACGILVPTPGIEPRSSALEGRFLTTGPWGKSLCSIYGCLQWENWAIQFHPPLLGSLSTYKIFKK